MALANSKHRTSEHDGKLRCPRGGAVGLVVSVVAMRNGQQGVMVYLHECRCTVAHVVGRFA